MSGSHHCDETDLVLLHALQIAPRASWAQLSEVLGISGATAARRWARLAERGDAWISAYTNNRNSGGAFVEVDCDANTAHSAAIALSTDPRALAVEETSGARDLLLTVSAVSVADLSGYLLRAQQVPGVRAVRSHVITKVVADASQWRLDALEPQQKLALQTAEPPPDRTPPVPDLLSKQLAVALSEDGRLPVTALAKRLSVSVNTIRRRMASLESSGWLRYRCDVTRAVSGHRIAATFWLSVPPGELLVAARTIAALPEIRLAVAVTGPQNLILMAWLRHPADLPQFEVELARRASSARIEDRAVTLQTVKHMGRMLDEHGRVHGIVPLDLWNVEGTEELRS